MSTVDFGILGGVASPEDLATKVGIAILQTGGNAVDAAVAVGLALAVTFPSAGNIGGGGFLIYKHPGGRNVAIDFRETAPSQATSDMYLDAADNIFKGNGGPVDGYRACGIPGSVAGFEMAWRNYGSGRLSWAALVDPAFQLARGGFPMNYALANSMRLSMERISSDTTFQNSFLILAPNGWHAKPIGASLLQPHLADTLRRIRDYGANDFYYGVTARKLASDIQQNGGIVSTTDLAAYRAIQRRPLIGRFKNHQVLTMPPPSSGGIALLQMLNMLERCSPLPDAYSVKYVHLVAQAMRRAFRDRSEFLGDADFVDVPVEKLLGKRHLLTMQQGLSSTMSQRTDDLTANITLQQESEQTTHFTVIDRDGGVVCTTYTLNGSYGAGVYSENTGILLNNEMDDFTAKVGVANQFGLLQSARNAIVPGKRPLSSMTPTIVMDDDNQVTLATGSPGGPTIINTVLHTVLQSVYFGKSLAESVAAPRFHHQWKPEVLQIESTLAAIGDALNAMGYVTALRTLGDVHAGAWSRRNGVTVVSDPRNSGVALAE